jgi:glycosyltransferase involved in cell wall biosynthesis
MHPNYPGQFSLLAKELASSDEWHVVAIGEGERDVSGAAGTSYHFYQSLSGLPEVHFPPVQALGDHVRRGRTAADIFLSLRDRGFRPDVVLAHPGWGDALFIRDHFPSTNYLAFLEYYYRVADSDIDFDPEFPPPRADLPQVRLRNLTNLLAYADASRSIAPTKWQASLFPDHIRDQLTVLHEGIDTSVVRPRPKASFQLPSGRTLTKSDEVVTYVARSLEPYRGFHVFMRALPDLLRARPEAQVVIVGGDGVSYGRYPPSGGSWRSVLLREVGGDIDTARVHFVGRLPYRQYQRLLNVSTIHVYLTYPFVLSWSLLEAMASGCAIVGSATGPVLEVIEDGTNGRTVDFFDRAALVDRICELITDLGQRERLSRAARESVIDRYDFRTRSLPRYLELMQQGR